MTRRLKTAEVDLSRHGRLVHDAQSSGRYVYVDVYIEGLPPAPQDLIQGQLLARTSEQAAEIARALREARTDETDPLRRLEQEHAAAWESLKDVDHTGGKESLSDAIGVLRDSWAHERAALIGQRDAALAALNRIATHPEGWYPTAEGTSVHSWCQIARDAVAAKGPA